MEIADYQTCVCPKVSVICRSVADHLL